jgi:hypothetical protein
MLYTKTGDLVCEACHANEQRADATQRIADNRTALMVGSAASAAAVGTFALYAYAYHDKTYVYVQTGVDASDRIIKLGLVYALAAAAVVGFLVNWVIGRARRSKP